VFIDKPPNLFFQKLFKAFLRIRLTAQVKKCISRIINIIFGPNAHRQKLVMRVLISQRDIRIQFAQ
jgi:hypothetical protein